MGVELEEEEEEEVWDVQKEVAEEEVDELDGKWKGRDGMIRGVHPP